MGFPFFAKFTSHIIERNQFLYGGNDMLELLGILVCFMVFIGFPVGLTTWTIYCVLRLIKENIEFNKEIRKNNEN